MKSSRWVRFGTTDRRKALPGAGSRYQSVVATFENLRIDRRRVANPCERNSP